MFLTAMNQNSYTLEINPSKGRSQQQIFCSTEGIASQLTRQYGVESPFVLLLTKGAYSSVRKICILKSKQRELINFKNFELVVRATKMHHFSA